MELPKINLLATPPKDVYSHSKKQLLGRLKMLYGGRIAEQMFTGDITTGAKSDIDNASAIVRKMVCEWGMSEKLGPIKYVEDDEAVFLGRDMGNRQGHSDQTAIAIDEEVRGMVEFCYKEAERLLTEHRDAIELIAKALMEHEVISGDDIDSLIKIGKIEKKLPVKQVVHRPLPKIQSKSHYPQIDIGGNGGTPAPAFRSSDPQ